MKTNLDISFETTANIDERVFEGSLYNWNPNDIQTARGVVFHNLSVAHAIRSEVELAKTNFDDVSLIARWLNRFIFYSLVFVLVCSFIR